MTTLWWYAAPTSNSRRDTEDGFVEVKETEDPAASFTGSSNSTHLPHYAQEVNWEETGSAHAHADPAAERRENFQIRR